MISARKIQWYGLVVGAPFLTVLTVILFGNPLFEGNDDTGLAMVGAGFGLAAAPEAHLIFSHYGYGLILNIVSRLVGPNAHGWMTLAALGLSMGLFFRSLCENLSASLYLLGAALVAVVGCVFVRALLEPQFTITAALLFASAIACWLAILRKGTRAPALSASIYGALILSVLIRPSALVLGLVVVGPALGWLAWGGPPIGRKPTRRLMSAIAVIALAAYLTDKAAYVLSTDWRDAMEYNQLRSLFNDYFRIPWIPGAPEYEKVGWSANDYSIFMNWYSLDPIFDYSNIKYLVQTLALHGPLLVFSGVGSWLTALWESSLLATLVVVPLVPCVLFPRYRTFALLVMIGGVIAVAASGLTGRPPQFRVWFSIVGVAILCTLPLILTAETRLRLSQKLGVAILAAIGLHAGLTVVLAHQARVVEAAAYRVALSEAKPYFSGTVISWGATLVWEWLITPTKVYPPIAGSTIPSIGLFTKMPVMQSTLRHLGIADLGSTLCTQLDVRLIADAEFVREVTIFCEEHYHVRPVYKQVFDHPRTKIFVSGPPDGLR